MGKRFEISDMPPLTVEMHRDLRLLERKLEKALESCCVGFTLFDPQAAFEYVRTYAIEFYDCFYGFYSQVPNPTYHPHWRPASEAFAFGRVAKCIENITVIERYFNEDPTRINRLRRTITDHAKGFENSQAIQSASIGNQASVYAASGIDIASGPPLLKMAAMLPPSAYEVPAALVLTPPKPKRLSAHITNPTAAKRMQEFMDAHCLNQTQFAIQANTSDKTIRKFLRTGQIKRSIVPGIASAMGITKEELLRS